MLSLAFCHDTDDVQVIHYNGSLGLFKFPAAPISHAICSILELEPSILRVICNILDLKPSIFHAICSSWKLEPSILQAICNILERRVY